LGDREVRIVGKTDASCWVEQNKGAGWRRDGSYGRSTLDALVKAVIERVAG